MFINYYIYRLNFEIGHHKTPIRPINQSKSITQSVNYSQINYYLKRTHLPNYSPCCGISGLSVFGTTTKTMQTFLMFFFIVILAVPLYVGIVSLFSNLPNFGHLRYTLQIVEKDNLDQNTMMKYIKRLEKNMEMLSAASTKDVRLSTVLLDEYGYELCPWMHLPKGRRYPRQLPKNAKRPHKLVNCVRNLNRATEMGQIVFTLFGGIDLGAITAGGVTKANSAGDDEDIDLRIVAMGGRTKSMIKRKYCNDISMGIPETFFTSYNPTGIDSFKRFFENEKITRISPNPMAQGRFSSKDGYHDDKHYSWLKGAHNHETWMINKGTWLGKNAEEVWLHGNLWKSFEGSCVAEWEGYPVLTPGLEYERHWNGASYWVPPAINGMKDCGHRFRSYFNPASTLFTHDRWIQSTFASLNYVDSSPADGNISIKEFLHYVQTSEQVNQKWLNATIMQNACDVLNAQIQYNHMLHYTIIGLRFKNKCKCNKDPWMIKQCNEREWNKFKKIYTGVPYVDVGDAFHGRPKSEIDPVKGTHEECKQKLLKEMPTKRK